MADEAQTTVVEDEVIFDTEDQSPDDTAGADGSGDDAKAAADAAAAMPKLNLSKFKEVLGDDDEEELDEDKVVTKVKSLRDENDNLKIIAAGSKLIEDDSNLKVWNDMKKRSAKDLYGIGLVQNYIESGLTEEEAQAKAEAQLTKIDKREDAADVYDDGALAIKKSLNNAITTRTKELQDKLKSAHEGSDLRTYDGKLIESMKSFVPKVEQVVGLKPAAATREKFDSNTVKYIESAQFKKDMKNPEVLAEVAAYLANKKAIQSNIQSRNSGAMKIVQKMDQNGRQVNGKATPVVRAPTGGNTKSPGQTHLKNPGAFLGTAK